MRRYEQYDDLGELMDFAEFPQRVGLLGAGCAVVLVAFFVFYFNCTLEDAHITFRYAAHLAEGDGLGAWNVGEPPVEGFTSFLWTVVIAAAIKAGLSPFTAAKVIGALSLASIAALCLLAWRRRQAAGRDQAADFLLVAAVLVCGYLPFSWYAMSGMEAVPFAALETALLVTPALLARPAARCALATVLSVLMVITRPEGILLAGLINCYHFATGGWTRSALFSRALPIFAAGAAFLAMTAFRYSYFGDLLPNTYYAKGQGGLLHAQHGVFYVGLFGAFTLPVWLVAARGLQHLRTALAGRGLALFLAGLLVLYTAYVVKVGGDPDAAFPMWRHYVHIAPIWVLLVAWLITAGFGSLGRQLAAAAIAVLLCDLLIGVRYRDVAVLQPAQAIAAYGLLANERPDPYFVWLRQFADGDTVSAAALAGQWGWYIPGRQIDVLGLNNRHIAHFGTSARNGAVDSTTDMNYVLDARPDIIDGYMSADSLLHGVCPNQMAGFRSEMLLTMVNNPIFRSEYVFVKNAPYQRLDRAIFIRKSYLARWPGAAIQSVPVGETALYQGRCNAA